MIERQASRASSVEDAERCHLTLRHHQPCLGLLRPAHGDYRDVASAHHSALMAGRRQLRREEIDRGAPGHEEVMLIIGIMSAPPFHSSCTPSVTQSADNLLNFLRERPRAPSLAPTIVTRACVAGPTPKGEISIAPYRPNNRHLRCAIRCTGPGNQNPIAPADRGAHVPRFPSLAAFGRRPGSHRACCELSGGAGIRNPSHKRA